MNIRYPIYEGVYRILTMFHILTIIFEKVKRSENKIRCFFIRLQIYSNPPPSQSPHFGILD